MTNSIDELKKQLQALQTSIDVLEEKADAGQSEITGNTADGPQVEGADVESAATDGGRRGGLVGLLSPGRSRLVAVVVVLALLAGGVAAFVLTKSSGLPDGIALRYDGANITVEKIDAEARTLGALYGVETPTEKAKLSDFRKALAKSYAVSLIVDHAAAEKGITIPEKTVQDVMGTYVVGQFGSGADAYDKFVQALAAGGTTEDAVRTEVRRQLVLSALFEDVTKNVSVSDSEVRASFDENRAELGQPATRRVSNIVVATKAEGDALVKRFNAGVPFTTLAKNYSLDGATRTKGGDLGYVAVSDLATGYAKVAFSSSVGKMFGPVKTESGWNVGIVRGARPAVAATFDAVRNSLTDQVKLKKQLDVWRTWLGVQIREAGVEYAAAYRPAHPNAAPAGDPAAVPSTPTSSSK